MNVPVSLNAFTIEHMRELLEYYGPGVETSKENLRSAATDADRVRIADFLRTKALNAGLLSYALGAPKEAVWAFFEQSVGACESMFQADSVEQWKNPLVLTDGVYLALILGEPGRAAALARAKRYKPGKYDDGRFSADEVVMGFVAAFLQYISGDVDAATNTARTAYDGSKSRREGFAKWFRWHMAALIATTERDDSAFSQAITTIAKLHANEARNGRLREDTRGLVCISGLALMRVGATAGLTAPNTPHLPAELLKP